jgi:predicted transcriptional regulator
MPRKKLPPDPNKKQVNRPDHKIPAFKKVMAKVMRDQGMSLRAIAKKLGVSHVGVKGVLDSGLDEMEEATANELKKKTSSDLVLISSSILAELKEPGVIESANFKDLMIGLGIAIEKQRLLDGESTSNVFSLISMQMQADRPAGKVIEVQKNQPDRPATLPEPGEVVTISQPAEGAKVPRSKGEK